MRRGGIRPRPTCSGPGHLLFVGLGGFPCPSPSETLPWDRRRNGESPSLKTNAFREAKWLLVVLEWRDRGAAPCWPGPSICLSHLKPCIPWKWQKGARREIRDARRRKRCVRYELGAATPDKFLQRFVTFQQDRSPFFQVQCI